MRQRFCSCRRRRCLSFLLASMGPGSSLGGKGEKNRRGRTVKAVMQTLGFALIGSLGPGSAVGEKGKKRGQIRKISASEGYLISQPGYLPLCAGVRCC